MERRMISASFIAEAVDCARRKRVAIAPLLASVGLNGTVEGPVSAEVYGALWLAIAKTIDDEFFGLAARPMRTGSFTLLCHCVIGAGSLGQALKRAIRFLNLVLDDPCGQFHLGDGLAQILLKDKGKARTAFAYRTYWIILHGLMCWLVGRRIPLRLVDFRCAAPAHGTDYTLFFGAPVQFGCPCSRLAFDERLLSLPITRTERTVKAFLRGAPANILVRYRYDAGVVATVRDYLRDRNENIWPSCTAVAEALRLPESTLRHHLQREGQSFIAVRDELRRDLAVEWLSQTDRSVGDIALALGFAEPSAFHRAFRKWTDCAPGQFRRNRR